MDDGFAALLAKLNALKGDGRVNAERKALRAVGVLIKDVIVDKAPERTNDTPSGTALAPGELKADIHARVQVASDEDIGLKRSRVVVGPGPNTAHVARWVENGHANKRGKKSSGKQTTLGSTPAHPFIRPAQDEVEQAAIDTYAEVITAELKKVMD